MTEEQIALARRAVACKGWRWMLGMLASDGGRVRTISTSRIEWDYFDAFGSGHASTRVESVSVLPDLTDAATLGCLLALVRDAWGDQTTQCRYFTGEATWCVCSAGGSILVDGRYMWGKSEAEALVVALETAP